MRFEPMKAIEAAAVIARQEGKRISRLRLLKLLYIAERELAKTSDRRLINGKLVAMDHGPLHSEAYNMIKGTSLATGMWSKYFTNLGPRDVVLDNEPELQLLSRLEVETILQMVSKYEHFDAWQLSMETHEFDEWKNNYEPQTSRSIDFEQVLSAVGRSNDIMDDIRESDSFDQLIEKYDH